MLRHLLRLTFINNTIVNTDCEYIGFYLSCNKINLGHWRILITHLKQNFGVGLNASSFRAGKSVQTSASEDVILSHYIRYGIYGTQKTETDFPEFQFSSLIISSYTLYSHLFMI